MSASEPNILCWCDHCPDPIYAAKTDCQYLSVILAGAAHGHMGTSESFGFHKECFKQFVSKKRTVLALLDGKIAKQLVRDQGDKLTNTCVPKHIGDGLDFIYTDNDVEPCLFCSKSVKLSDAVAVLLRTDDSSRSHPCTRQLQVAHKNCVKKLTIFKRDYVMGCLQSVAETRESLGLSPTPPPRKEIDEPGSECATPPESESVDPKSLTDFQQVLYAFLERLAEISTTFDELYDTDCREQMSDTLLRKFVLRQRGIKLPDEFGLFEDAGNLAVREAIKNFTESASSFSRRKGFTTATERLASFQDDKVKVSEEALTYEDFFGHVELDEVEQLK